MNEKAFIYKLPNSLAYDNHLEIEKDIIAKMGHTTYEDVILDAKDTLYVSSAGLRIILSIAKKGYNLKVINTSPEVYDIFQMTGFTSIIDVERALRQVSIEGCKCIGKGAHGTVYSLAPDTIVKVYQPSVSLEEIKEEREISKKAFVLGLPTAIALDIVKVGEQYGTIFELLDASSCVDYVNENQANTNDFIDKSVAVLKKLHNTVTNDDSLPDMKKKHFTYLSNIKKFLSEEEYQKIYQLLEETSNQKTLIHGDYHLKNLLMCKDELMLIDMDTLCVGDPIFELSSICNSYYEFGTIDESIITDFLGISIEKANYIWFQTSRKYYSELNDEEYAKQCLRIKLFGCVRAAHFFNKHQVEQRIIDKTISDLKETLNLLG